MFNTGRERITINYFDGEDREFSIICDYIAAVPGLMYNRFGDPGDPPEPEEIDIVKINPVIKSGATEEMADDLMDKIYTNEGTYEKVVELVHENLRQEDDYE